MRQSLILWGTPVPKKNGEIETVQSPRSTVPMTFLSMDVERPVYEVGPSMHDRQTAVSHLSTVLLFLINATGNSDRFDRKNRSDGLLPGDQPENQRQD